MVNPYEINIRDLLSDVWETGFAKIEWRKLYRWYGIDRITNKIWIDLEEKWQELDERRGSEGWILGYLDWDEGQILTLVCLDPPKTAEKDASFKPIAKKIAPKKKS